jgi:hypothetical protein
LQSTLAVSGLVHPVIDARGIRQNIFSPNIPNNLACTGSQTPWVQGTQTFANPSTILLPAGEIITNATWVLPSMTKLIGVGAPDPGDPAKIRETTIMASATFPPSTAILQMGGSGMPSVCPLNINKNPICTGIVISNLILNGGLVGNGNSIDGIDNFNAQEGSFVEHVNMYFLGGTGLNLGKDPNSPNSAIHSGPYSDIWFEASGATGLALTTACVRIKGFGPRGIHGITCAGSPTNTPLAAIYLDGSNVSIEDVHVEGFQDGIVVGATGQALSNVVFNVTGVSSENGNVKNTVHICNPSNPAPNSACTSGTWTVVDLSLQAIAVGGSPLPNSIEDDLTSTTLTDMTVGLYAIGQRVTDSGVSRFSTSANTPAWRVGSGMPFGVCKQGSLFSNTNGTSPTLYVCGPGGWVAIK